MLTLGIGLGRAAHARQLLTYNPAAMKYDGAISLDVSTEDGSVSGLAFNADGTQLLISGIVSDDVFRYDGCTFADISAGVVNNSVTDVLSNNPTGLLYNDDGTRMFVFQSGTAIEGYNCTAYTPSTNAYSAGYRLALTGTNITYARGMCFNKDGTMLLVVGAGSRTIHCYDLATPYNPGSGTRNASKSFDFSGVIGPSGDMSAIRWLNEDKIIHVCDIVSDTIYHIALGTAGDPSTGVNVASKALDISFIDNAVMAFDWSPDGNYLYLAGQQFDKIHVLSRSVNLDDNLGLVLLGDSLVNDTLSTPGASAYINTLDEVYDYVAVHDMAQGGLALITSDNTGAFWNKDTNAPTTTYANFLSSVGNRHLVQAIALSLGTNAISLTGGNPAEWKASFAELITQLKTDFPNLRFVVPLVLGNNIPFDDGGANTLLWQTGRETMLDALALDAVVHRGVEVYDLPLELDGIHPTSAGYATLVNRITARVLGLLAGESTGTLGPHPTSGSFTDGSAAVTIQVTHDGGSSLSGTGTETDYFRIEVNGVKATINAMSVNADNIVFTLSSELSSGDDVKFWCNYGAGANVTQANVVRDNNSLPLLTIYEMDVAEV